MRKIDYLSKRQETAAIPWVAFGAPSQTEYEKWSPEVCAICCLKMIGDFFDLTRTATIYQLAIECRDKEGFKELSGGKIDGVFHQPLLDIAKTYGLEGEIASFLSTDSIISKLQKQKFVLLSINKAKVNSNLRGSHMILVYDYDDDASYFYVHDPEPILAAHGQDIIIDSSRLNAISNSKGLVLWKA